MFSMFNKTDSYAFYYVEEEWTNGSYPWTQRLIGYDAEKERKEVVLEIRSENAREKRKIVAAAKAKSYLWCCYKESDEQIEIVKTDFYGKNAVVVAKTKMNGFVDKMWANDKNVYIMTGDAVYQIDSKGCMHEVLSELCTEYFCGKITESFFLLYDSYRDDAHVLIFDNDRQCCEEYSCDMKFMRNDVYSEQAWCAGVYDGKAAVIKGFGTEKGEVSGQVLYILDRTKKEWNECILWVKERDSHKSEAGNAVFAYIQTGKNELFAQSGPVLTLFQEDCMGMFRYDVNERKRQELCVTEGWCNAEGTHIVSKSGRYVYTCVWCDRKDGYMMTEVNLDTGVRKVIVKDEGEYLISTCEE